MRTIAINIIKHNVNKTIKDINIRLLMYAEQTLPFYISLNHCNPSY